MRRLGLGRTKRNQNYAKTKRRDRIIYLTVYEDRESECFMRINAKAVVALAAALVVLAAWAMGCELGISSLGNPWCSTILTSLP